MSRTVDHYLKRVCKRQYASRTTKERLLLRLREEISELGDSLSMDRLIKCFGTPAQAAQELQGFVGEAEAYSARSKSKRMAIMLGIVVVVLVVSLAAYAWYVYGNDISVVNRTIGEISEAVS